MIESLLHHSLIEAHMVATKETRGGATTETNERPRLTSVIFGFRHSVDGLCGPVSRPKHQLEDEGRVAQRSGAGITKTRKPFRIVIPPIGERTYQTITQFPNVLLRPSWAQKNTTLSIMASGSQRRNDSDCPRSLR
jgi:hypothetical protein